MNVKNILLEGKGKIIQEVEAKAMNKTKEIEQEIIRKIRRLTQIIIFTLRKRDQDQTAIKIASQNEVSNNINLFYKLKMKTNS